MEEIGDIIGLVGLWLVIVIVFLIIFGFMAFLRFMRYKETVALAEKGLLRPERTRGNGTNTLRWGIIITAIGLALSVGLYPIGFIGSFGSQFPFYFGPWMLVGLMPTFFGLGLVLIYVITGEKKQPETKAEVLPVESLDE